ncbi:MAG: hypothetical protein WC851_00270 [Candidatus Shapirobacteria bacterium]|jgi:hypothetical protein
MTIIHNQINRFWSKPTYENFKKHGFVKKVFTINDSEEFIKTGAYLVEEAIKQMNSHIPWDESRKFEILLHPRLENIFLALGTEYFLKGILLAKGYAINKPKMGISLAHPIPVSSNKTKLLKTEVQDLSYIKDQIIRTVDFSDFDKSQESEKIKEKKVNKGKGVRGITSLSVPHPTAKQILDYLHFKRNFSLHRPFIISEFSGIVQQELKILNYIAQKETGETIKKLSSIIHE